MKYYNNVILQNNVYCVKRLYEHHKIIILLFNFKGTYLPICYNSLNFKTYFKYN